MRAVGPLVATLVVLLTFLPGRPPRAAVAQSSTDQAAVVLTAVLQGLGGAERLKAIKSFVATGRTRQVRGDNLVPIEFQIWWESPDKYVRRDEFPTQDSGPTTSGFHGSVLIDAPESVARGIPGRAGGPPSPPSADVEANRNARVAGLKEDVARMMLGMFAGAVTVIPLTFTYVGLAEAPQGQADVLEAKGPPNFVARFFVDRATRLPVMLTWQAPPNAGPGLPPPGGRARGPAPAPAIGPQPSGSLQPPSRGSARGETTAENRIYFADYRMVDEVKWPFRIRRAVGPDPVEETNFDGFRLNVRIDRRRFEAARP